MTISSDSRWVATFSSYDESVTVSRISNGLVVHDWHYPRTVCVEFSQDGRYLGICTTTHVVLRDAHAEDFHVVACSDLDPGLPRSCSTSWSPDGTLFAAISMSDTSHHVSDTPCFHGSERIGQPQLRLYKSITGQELLFHRPYLPYTLLGERSRWSGPFFSHDGRWLLCTYTQSPPACHSLSWIWDTQTTAVRWTTVGTHDAEGEKRVVTALFNPVDSEMVATGSEDGVIRIWNVDTHSVKILVKDYNCSMLNMLFSPDGKYIACHQLQTLRVWSVLTGDTVLSREIDIPIYQTTFSPDSRWLALACEDGTVRLWDIRLRSCVGSFRAHNTVVTSLAFSPYGDILCSGAKDGTVHIHRLRAALPQRRHPEPELRKQVSPRQHRVTIT